MPSQRMTSPPIDAVARTVVGSTIRTPSGETVRVGGVDSMDGCGRARRSSGLAAFLLALGGVARAQDDVPEGVEEGQARKDGSPQENF
jgi:hypothetical protein